MATLDTERGDDYHDPDNGHGAKDPNLDATTLFAITLACVARVAWGPEDRFGANISSSRVLSCLEDEMNPIHLAITFSYLRTNAAAAMPRASGDKARCAAV